MKQAILSFGKADVLLRVPDPDQAWVIENMHPNIMTSDGRDWEYLGKLSELTEEHFAEIVDCWQRYFPATHTVYCNYNYPVEYDAIKGKEQRWSHPFGKARESFVSKMEAEGYYTKNPYAETRLSFSRCSAKDKRVFTDLVKQRRENAEARTFPPDQTYVFIILKK